MKLGQMIGDGLRPTDHYTILTIFLKGGRIGITLIVNPSLAITVDERGTLRDQAMSYGPGT